MSTSDMYYDEQKIPQNKMTTGVNRKLLH